VVYAAKTARSEKMWIQPTAGSWAHASPHSQRGGNPDVSNSCQKNASMAISAIPAAGRGSLADRDRRGAMGTWRRRSAAYRLTASRGELAAASHDIVQDELVCVQQSRAAGLPQARLALLSSTRPCALRFDTLPRFQGLPVALWRPARLSCCRTCFAAHGRSPSAREFVLQRIGNLIEMTHSGRARPPEPAVVQRG